MDAPIAEHVRYDMRCIDVGAGLGDTTYQLSHLVGSHRGWVYAFEPCRFRQLARRVQTWGLTNVTSEQMAIMPFSGPCVADMVSREVGINFRIHQSDAPKRALFEAVTAITVDDFCAIRGKIDVIVVHSGVGMTNVLAGARKTIQKWKPIIIGGE